MAVADVYAAADGVAARPTATATTFSIGDHFDGSVVLLTGASGYIGSLVLERLLRTTRVAAVYCLLRERRGQDARARLSSLLSGCSLFHAVRGDAALVAKAIAVSGDMLLPNLGLSASDAAELAARVDTIVACAADIRLEVDVRDTLAANYEGLRQLLALAAGFARLKAFVHVSSAYANINAGPRGTVVCEALYPLRFGGQDVDPAAVAAELMALPSAQANARAAAYARRWGFPNNYVLGKNLAERLVAAAAAAGMPAAIVRPSLVSSVALAPLAGYAGNWAGPLGAAAAMAIGLFDRLDAVASQPTGVWDIIPGDYVASAVLAAAAALGAPGVADAVRADAAAAVVAGGAPVSPPPPPLLIVHSASSSTYPLTLLEGWNHNLDFFEAHKPGFRLAWRRLERMTPEFAPSEARVEAARRRAGRKVAVVSGLLRMLGKQREARKLEAGYETFCVHNSAKTDCGLTFSTLALVGLAARLAPRDAAEHPLVWAPQCARGGGKVAHHDDGAVSWRRYTHTMLARQHSQLFGAAPPRRAVLPARRTAVFAEGFPPTEDVAVVHDYVHVR